jgi:hypothetical protein
MTTDCPEMPIHMSNAVGQFIATYPGEPVEVRWSREDDCIVKSLTAT